MGNSYADWGLQDLHRCLLNMLIDIDKVCTDNDIQYTLAYGSVLGAIRHIGFIPWDDDVDIYMDSESYNKFKKAISNSSYYSQKYYLQEYDSIEGMCELPKLRLNGTAFIEELFKDMDMHQGIYIDIFILHNAAPTVFRRKKQNLWNQYLLLKGLANRDYKASGVFRMLIAVLKLFPYNFLRKKALRELYRYDSEESDAFYDNDLRKYRKSFYSKEMIFPSKRVRFEGYELPVPNCFDQYLRQVYGEYMIPPQIEQITQRQHSSYWSTSTDYKDYCSNIKNFSDERKGSCLK